MEELKFEKLSDVEVVEEPSEESHVLIVEGGEVKKAPKTAVGGAKEEWDAVISVEGGHLAPAFANNASYISGDYSAIEEKILNGELPNVLVQWHQVYGPVEYLVVAKGRDFSLKQLSTGNEVFMNIGTGHTNTYMGVYLYSNGTFRS